MGNNLGIQIQNTQIKVAYLAKTLQDINLIDEINSQYLQKRLELKNNHVIFFAKFTIQEFIQLRFSKKIETLQKHYGQILEYNIDIFMNTETQLSLETNINIKQTIKQLIKRDFTPKNRDIMESSIKFLYLIDTQVKKQVFFHFNSYVKVNQLHLISKQLKIQKTYSSLPDAPYLLVNLRKGSSIYLVNSHKNVEKIAGSIIGERTIYNIIKAMNNWKEIDLQQIFIKTFAHGDNKNADLLVEDIYGKLFTDLGMDGNIIASSMGKVAHGAQCSFQDKYKSLILSFAINIAMVIQLQMKIQNNNNCVLLANKFHDQYFYLAVQSIVKFFHPEGHILFGDVGNYMGCLGNIQLQ